MFELTENKTLSAVIKVFGVGGSGEVRVEGRGGGDSCPR